ncbi:inner membrane-spanning protein YciB [uncultured Brevundimonas sp.]|uniref:inner membrane-spanning protein YciB n=1 Tax=uncultured Brevundimonas sp. TaxID=213418 RepID=UPI0030EE13AC|tara:strand:- start:76504 stop:77124 length:621 start_codon:yes stop_codon:yes gene_type:complete
MTEMTTPNADPAPKSGQWIRQAVDFGALLAFAAAYFITRDMIKATWVLVIASTLALATGYFVEKRFAPLPLITGLFALVFGTMTIVFHDESLIKIKLTVQNALLATVLLGSLPLNKSPFKYLLGDAIRVTDQAWRVLTLRYGLYFATVAVTNELIWRTQSDATWVQFRVGLFILAIVFGLLQVPYIMKNMQKDGGEPGPITPDPGI